MLICDLIIPIVMIIGGRMMWKHCPKHINGIVGYRTTRSMKNMDTWKFAHDYCGKLWLLELKNQNLIRRKTDEYYSISWSI